MRLVLLGQPVAHSLSPAMQNAALARAGLDVRYEALDVPADALASTLARLAAEPAYGNVTIPHKEAVYELAARRTDSAERVGAVNTFWFERGDLVGDNTDVAGFDALVRSVLGETPRGARLAVIGAGGAARAVCAAAVAWPARTVSIWSRRSARALEVAARFGHPVTAHESLSSAIRGAELVVNATPLGLRPGDPFPVDLELLRPDAVLIDLVYHRGGTPWVRAARARGYLASDGSEMLVAQGAEAFERWFGFRPDVEAMRQVVWKE